MKLPASGEVFLTRSLVEESFRSRWRLNSVGKPTAENKKAALPVKLFAQLQFFRDVLITTQINVLQIIEQATALADHYQQPATRAVIFFVRLQMFRQMVDAMREQRNLHVRRTRVFVVRLELFNCLCLRFHNELSAEI
jgi:hypothetical protein